MCELCQILTSSYRRKTYQTLLRRSAQHGPIYLLPVASPNHSSVPSTRYANNFGDSKLLCQNDCAPPSLSLDPSRSKPSAWRRGSSLLCFLYMSKMPHRASATIARSTWRRSGTPNDRSANSTIYERANQTPSTGRKMCELSARLAWDVVSWRIATGSFNYSSSSPGGMCGICRFPGVAEFYKMLFSYLGLNSRGSPIVGETLSTRVEYQMS
jgi:hypothetical protein